MNLPRALRWSLTLALAYLSGCSTRAAEPAPTLAETPAQSSTPDSAVIEQATPTVAPQSSEPTVTSEEGEQAMPLVLSSGAFEQGEDIPLRYSCDGEDISPSLQWTDPPPGTQSFALVMDDPDAPGGTWVHWVLFNLPASAGGLPEGVSAAAEQPDGGRHGTNSFGGPGYGGPCPPGGTHRYFFKLYALDQLLDLPALADKSQLESAMQGHVLAQAELMGTYSR